MLDFDAEGMQELHILTENLNFPIAIPLYTYWQKTQFGYLQSNVKTTKFSTYDICKWCITHKLQYRILYPLSKKFIFVNPYKYYKYLEMTFKLKEYSLQNAKGKLYGKLHEI